jgi:hypothetical protein
LAFVSVAVSCACSRAVISARNAAMVMVGEPRSATFAVNPLYIPRDLNRTPGMFFFVVPKLARGLD